MKMKELIKLLLSLETILLIYAFLLGWMFRSKYKDILYFFQENWVAIFCVGFFVVLPFSCLVLFFVNIYIWQIELLDYLLLGIAGGVCSVFVWIMRSGKKEVKKC